MSTDEILWEGMLQGNQEMFLELYNKYYHTLLFLGLKEVRDPQLVKDSIQQLFLYLWEKRDTIRQAKSVKSYILTSFLRKLNADWKRAAKASHLHVVYSQASEEIPPTPEECLIKKDGQEQLCKTLMPYINELPRRQKELIFLKFYEGLSYDEIAQQTGLSQRTIYNSIHEALKRLKLDINNSAQQPVRASALLGLVAIMATLQSIQSGL